MNQVSLLDVLTILVSVTTFTTGFLSVRIHAERYRALEGVDRIKERLDQLLYSKIIEGDETYKLLNEEIKSYKEAHLTDPVARLTVYGNLSILFIVTTLIGLIIFSRGWQLTFNPVRISPEFIGLAAVIIVEAALVALGFYDLKFVKSDLDNRLRSSVAFKLRKAIGSSGKNASEKDRNEAICLLREIIEVRPMWYLPYELRAENYYRLGLIYELDPTGKHRYYGTLEESLQKGYTKGLLNEKQNFFARQNFQEALNALEACRKMIEVEVAQAQSNGQIPKIRPKIEVFMRLSEINRKLENIAQAEKYLDMAKAVSPESVERWNSQHDLERTAHEHKLEAIEGSQMVARVLRETEKEIQQRKKEVDNSFAQMDPDKRIEFDRVWERVKDMSDKEFDERMISIRKENEEHLQRSGNEDSPTELEDKKGN